MLEGIRPSKTPYFFWGASGFFVLSSLGVFTFFLPLLPIWLFSFSLKIIREV